MGWASGSEVFDSVWREVRTFVPSKCRVGVCAGIIAALEMHDWDTQEECICGEWPEVAAALRKLHPGWYEEEG